MEIKTHLSKIENYFIYVPIILFLVYPFLIDTSSTLHIYYLITFAIIIIFNMIAIKLIEEYEDIFFRRLKKAYRLYVLVYIIIVCISWYLHILEMLSHMGA